jgi:DNA-binding response OmpR family regulator
MRLSLVAEAERIIDEAIDEALDESIAEIQRKGKRFIAKRIAEAEHVVVGGIDWKRRQFIRDGKRMHVPHQEWRIFERLITAKGAFVTKDQLFHHLYGDRIDGGPEGNIIPVYISKLRKLCPYPIKTTYGAGYSIRGVSKPIEEETQLPPTVSGISIARLRAGR